MTLFAVDAAIGGLCQVCGAACPAGLVDMTANTWRPLVYLLALPEGHVVLGTLQSVIPSFSTLAYLLAKTCV